MNLRVVQWGIKDIGSEALRAVTEHPALDLAGIFIEADPSTDRSTREVRTAYGRGVVVTCDIAEILRVGADCVVYMPSRLHVEDVVRVLKSGANVVTTLGELQRGPSMAPEVRAQVEAACDKGNASLHSTGGTNGFVCETLALALLSLQRRFDRLAIDEAQDMTHCRSRDLLLDTLGFGKRPSDDHRSDLVSQRAAFGPSLELVADALSLPLDSVESSVEVAVAPRTIELTAGTIVAGRVAARRLTTAGIRGGRPILCFRTTWYCSRDLSPSWTIPMPGWRIDVEGDASLRLELAATRPPGLPDRHAANRAVNAIPSVCAARTGIRSTLELQHVVALLG